MKWILYTLIAVAVYAGYHHSSLKSSVATIARPVTDRVASAKRDIDKNQTVQNVMDDMNQLNSKWQTFRNSLYKDKLKLSDKELERIQSLRNQYQGRLDTLASRLKSASQEKKAEVMTEITNQSAKFNGNIEAIVGKERFSELKEWKNHFNKEVQKHFRASTEVRAFW